MLMIQMTIMLDGLLISLELFDLKQHVRVITHKDGHTHDLVITRCDDSLVTKYKGL